MKTFLYLTELQLAFLVKLVTKKKFEDKKKTCKSDYNLGLKRTFGQLNVTYYKETPQSPKQGIPELPDQIRCVEVKAVGSDRTRFSIGRSIVEYFIHCERQRKYPPTCPGIDE